MSGKLEKLDLTMKADSSNDLVAHWVAELGNTLNAAIDRINELDELATMQGNINITTTKAFDRLPNIVNKYGLHVDELEARYEGHFHYHGLDATPGSPHPETTLPIPGGER